VGGCARARRPTVSRPVNRPFRTELEASAELEKAAVWYEGRRPGLGLEFLEAVDATLERIARWPQAARRVPRVAADRPARKAPVSNFPYHVAYLETPAPSGFSHSLTTAANPATGIPESGREIRLRMRRTSLRKPLRPSNGPSNEGRTDSSGTDPEATRVGSDRRVLRRPAVRYVQRCETDSRKLGLVAQRTAVKEAS
jgi:hypothetical protein